MKTRLISLTVVALLFCSAQSLAAFYADALGGITIHNAGSGAKPSVGARVGLNISRFSVGISGTYLPLGEIGSPNLSMTSTEVPVLGEINVGLLEWLYAGAKAGVIVTQSKSLGAIHTNASFAWGPAAGVQYMLGPIFRVGGEISLIIVSTPVHLSFLAFAGVSL